MKIKILFFCALFALAFPGTPALAQPPAAVEQTDTTLADSVPADDTLVSDPAEVTDTPEDPHEPGISETEIVARYVAWFGFLKLAMIWLVGWAIKLIGRLRKKTVTDAEEKAKRFGGWFALAVFLPAFVLMLLIGGDYSLEQIIAIGFGVFTGIGIHATVLNPIEALLKKIFKKKGTDTAGR